MNNSNLKTRIKLEIDKADESLKGSQVLLASELYDEAVSSAYYAMFQMYNDLLIDVKESREAGDYDAARKFTKEDALEKVENATKFNQHILNYLKEKDFI
jgi:uncharacterized protein (UPF0332 family)